MVFLIHGWSVREARPYQTLHRKLAQSVSEVIVGNADSAAPILRRQVKQRLVR